MPRRLSVLPPPWCLAGCPNGHFLPPWCPPGASQAVQLILFLPFWCLAGCPIGPFLPPWCLPGASQAVELVLSCLPGASQAVQMVISCLPGASLVPLSCLPGASLAPRRLSKWSFPASLVPRRLSNWSESRFWTGAGFCLNFSTTSMANGPVRGRSWGGPHGRLPVAQAGP